MIITRRFDVGGTYAREPLPFDQLDTVLVQRDGEHHTTDGVLVDDSTWNDLTDGARGRPRLFHVDEDLRLCCYPAADARYIVALQATHEA